MPSSYDPRPSLLWMAETAFDDAARLIAVGIACRERAGAAHVACYEAALAMAAEERGMVRIETAILDKLTSERVAAGDLDDDP